MATFVLVHGAYHGGWCWWKVAPLLRQQGHQVVTPTLTGMGERSHLATPETGLLTHVQDIVNTLMYEDLRDVILVGHSYGGMAVTGAGDRSPDRIARVIYLDALVPENGESAADVFDSVGARATTRATDQFLAAPPPPSVFGIADPTDLAWMTERFSHYPVRCSLEPLTLTHDPYPVPRAYLWCSDRPEGMGKQFRRGADKAIAEGWPYAEVHAGHDAMVTHPVEVSTALIQLAEL